MRASILALVTMLSVATLAPGCAMDTIPDGLRKTPAGDGPKVVFDLTKRPLPDIPIPNDTATFADPTSRTGRRINVSLVAPTTFESLSRRGFGSLEGWGTFAPISVSFEKPPGIDARLPAIDLDDVVARTVGDDFDPTNDPFYVIDLETGLPVPIETGNGLFPATIVNPDLYWPNDPHRSESALLFETREEGAGLLPGQYDPALDTDFDGIVDHPNTWPQKRTTTDKTRTIDELLTFYERETDTLILRPVVPLREKHEYAVVLTDRLRDTQKRPVRSPFEAVHHVAQRGSVAKVGVALGDPQRANYYGDLAGTGFEHVAFAWTFTTGPQTEDLRLLRDGLHGRGPFAYLANDFPVKARAFEAAGLAREQTDETRDLARKSPSCQGALKRPYIAKIDALLPQFRQFIDEFFGLSGPEADLLLESLKEVDHFVLGTFESPYFLGEDPAREDPDGRFELDYTTGKGRVRRDTVHFWLSVPKAKPGRAQPFPVTTWSHGTTLNGAEILLRAGSFAKQGLAMIGIDMPGHGLVLTPGQEQLAEAIFREQCIVPWVNGVASGRAHDLDEDGTRDSGGYIWSAHIFHSRDNIRQSVVDLVQTTRLLRSFDGKNLSDQDFDGDGRPNLAGDFDGDGTPDVGGSAPLTTAGNSFGGILAMVHGAVDHEISATASISGGGGLVDVATRSTLTPDPVLQQVLGPIVLALPGKDRKDDTSCSEAERSVRILVNDLITTRELEIACLSEAELPEKSTVVVTNVSTKEVRCARVDGAGRFRTPLPTNVGDRLDIQVYTAGGADAVTSYGTCALRPDAAPGRRITTWEKPRKKPRQVGDESKTCEAAVARAELPEGTGCQQFRGTFFPVGTDLVAPQEGLGLRRGSKEARRLLALTQAALDPGDPVSYAPLYARLPRLDPTGARIPPRGVAEMNTVGDPLVPAATGYAFARASGALPFMTPEAADLRPEYAEYATPRTLYAELGNKTPDTVLREAWVMEGVSRLGRTKAGPTCTTNRKTSALCGAPTKASQCARALVDADWLSEGRDLQDAPRTLSPLRLARDATRLATDTPSLGAAWAPRLLGSPATGTDGAYTASTPLLSVMTIYGEPTGYHVWTNGDPCRAFDHATHATGMLVRYLATGARDLYPLSHPKTHGCLADESCDFLRATK